MKKNVLIIAVLLCFVGFNTACNTDSEYIGIWKESKNNLVGVWEVVDCGDLNSLGFRITFYENGKTDINSFNDYIIKYDSIFCVDNDFITLGYTFSFSDDYNLLHLNLFEIRRCDTCIYNDMYRYPYYIIDGILKRVR